VIHLLNAHVFKKNAAIIKAMFFTTASHGEVTLEGDEDGRHGGKGEGFILGKSQLL